MGGAFPGFLLLMFINIGAVSGDITTDWAQLQSRFWDWRMQVSPEFSTYKGIYRYNDLVTPRNISHFTVIKEGVDGFIQELKTINRTLLNRKDQMNYDILEDLLVTYSDSYKWLRFAPVNPINFLEGIHIDLGSHINAIPFHTRGDFENFVARLTRYPSQVENIIYNFQQAIDDGHTLNNVSIDRVPQQIDSILRDDPRQFAYFAPFNGTLDNMTSIAVIDKESLRVRAIQAIESYMTSLQQLRDFIKDVYLAQTRTGWGVGSWERGREFYEACLKWHLSVAMTAEEVHEKGLEEVDRISEQMIDTMRSLNFSGTIRDFFATLKSEPRFQMNTSDDIMVAYHRMLEQITSVLPGLFKDIPDRKVIIEPMPTDGPIAMYLDGAEDGTRPGTFYINLRRPQESPSFNMMPVLLHEALPGHHLQSIYSQTANLPNYRKGITSGSYADMPVSFPMYTAYAEGWGLYAEYLGEEMGVYDDKYKLMGHYSLEIFRACRMVVDSGLHVFNWTRADAVEFLLNYTSYGRDDAEIEIDRYITWPGQACAYKVGELKIKEVRAKAERQLGDKFDIRDFHSLVLNSGQVPLSLLEKVVDEWIEEVDRTSTSSTTPGQTGECPVSSADNSRQFTCLTMFLLCFTFYVSKRMSVF